MGKTIQETIQLEKIVGGGQALGKIADGRKAFVWGGLPGETVRIQSTKVKSKMIEALVTDVIEASEERVDAQDADSYISTSPWQMMGFEAEQHYKSALIEEAFELHNIVLPSPIAMYSDGVTYGYRNKVEFSWWGDTDNDGNETLDLAFFRRGTKGKIPIQGTSLARKEINTLAQAIRDLLQHKKISGRSLKTVMIRCDQLGNCVWQLYIKDQIDNLISESEAKLLPAQGGEVIYSDPRSPASRITKRLASYGDVVLKDNILGVPFRYVCEGFFQVNVPVYEHALKDMQSWIGDKPTVDFYSGVGTIGLTIGNSSTLVEINSDAVTEMKRNIESLGVDSQAVLAPAEKATEYITDDKVIIMDPPRAGLHQDVIDRLLEVEPERIVYLSCNPVTQARDVMLLAEKYGIKAHQGYNFFPRTPHIEHLVVLDLKRS